MINSYEARARLDAGTWGTMGVGPGFALAAQALNPGKRVVALEGDAAFGFGSTEVETAVRHQLPITWVIMNNNGIGQGVEEIDRSKPIPAGVLQPGSHYERIIEGVRRQGVLLHDAGRGGSRGQGFLCAGGVHADPRGDRASGDAAQAGVRLGSRATSGLAPGGPRS